MDAELWHSFDNFDIDNGIGQNIGNPAIIDCTLDHPFFALSPFEEAEFHHY